MAAQPIVFERRATVRFGTLEGGSERRSELMKIRILNSGDEGALEDFLRPHIDSSLFLISNLRRAGLVDRGEPFEGTYFAAEVDGRIAGVVAQFWQGNLVLQAPDFLSELVAHIGAHLPRPIRGLLGPAAQVAAAEARLALPEEKIMLADQEGLYSLALAELKVPPDLAAGRISGRRIEERDLEIVTAFRFDYHQEALGAEATAELRAQCAEDMAASLERGDTWVLEAGGEIVAQTSYNAATREAVQVGGVWTPPGLRGRGYGRSAVAVSLLESRQEGVERGILFTGDDNVSAVRAYAALGFERIGDYRVVLVGG